jgi:hypothetical protein
MMNIDQMREMVSRLRRLPRDWDGENSPPITEQAIASCNRLIGEFEDLSNRPIRIGQPPVEYPVFLYPALGGGISLWMDDFGKDIITILPDGAVIQVIKEKND